MNVSKRRAGLVAVALTLTAIGGLHAQEIVENAIIYCKATIVSGSGTLLAVELPPTPGYTDPYGIPVTIWNVGNVAVGGDGLKIVNIAVTSGKQAGFYRIQTTE